VRTYRRGAATDLSGAARQETSMDPGLTAGKP
jgi:hypothetical protein